MKGRAILYSATELEWLERNRTLPIGEYTEAFRSVFQRTDVNAMHLHGLRKRKGWKTGRTGRFTPGQRSHNKGKTMPFHPNSAATRFKPGTAPHNRRPLWSERIGKDGYIEMKVPLLNPYTGHATRWIHKHRYLWEQRNGLLPQGHALKSLDGNKLNTASENWIAVPRGLLPRLNGGPRKKRLAYDDAPDAFKPTLLAVAQLEQKTFEIRTSPQRHPQSRNSGNQQEGRK